ncbi:hypothetical protein B0T10DRAFT_457686 [Thelonectria olida]|uniref:Uncharacterized protein n=1 Tax=Thelonectria olida TaxID=1576542 RepID=A0A9P8WA32_9HYPO|nr:hypothetical protein B0T10DRAFT_457686 [Thelonectria olida]
MDSQTARVLLVLVWLSQKGNSAVVDFSAAEGSPLQAVPQTFPELLSNEAVAQVEHVESFWNPRRTPPPPIPLMMMDGWRLSASCEGEMREVPAVLTELGRSV